MGGFIVEGSMIKLYPGGNTSLGFYSFYDYIINEHEAKKIYVIKGGPGTGKSTFMKKIASDLMSKGYDVELHYCSSDNNSLDGLVIPKLRVAMLDGTAPHIVDPKNPGAVDTILHMGDYWNEKAMRKNREDIFCATFAYKRCFRRAYDYFKVASVYWHTLNAYYADFEAIDIVTLRRHVNKILAKIFNDVKVQMNVSKVRNLFASAITPKGCVNALPIIAEKVSNRIVINEQIAMGQNMLINQMINELQMRGIDYTAFHCALHPNKIEHLLVPALDLIVITSNSYHTYQPETNDIILEMKRFTNFDLLGEVESEREELAKLLNNSIEKGASFIAMAKVNHDILEASYVPHMDFDKIEELRLKVVEEILSRDK